MVFEAIPNNPDLFMQYEQAVDVDIQMAFDKLKLRAEVADNLKIYTSIAAMASSKIEGETLDIDSYLKHTMQGMEFLPSVTEKPDDLLDAYQYAQAQPLSKDRFLTAHTLLAQHLLPESERGVCRRGEQLIIEEQSGTIKYTAAMASVVNDEFDKLWLDIHKLLSMELDTKKVFFYASLIHLVFVNIHPFNDGNGRAARLLEKWFLAQKLSEKAWYVSSEKYYYKEVDSYNRNLAVLGMFYEQLDYSKSLPFITMLPQSLIFENAS